MKVFISWSGDNSKKLAEVLSSWLPAVLQAVKPYFTPSDIEKGARWNTEIAKELESSEAGILCMTRDNLHSDWLMFEAGALAKRLDKTFVCPVLFGIQNTDLAGPLKQFQTTEFSKDDFKKLVTVVNSKLGDNKLDSPVVNSVFDKWWPDLESQVKEILNEFGDSNDEPIRPDRELLEEVLELSRYIERNMRRQGISPEAVKDLLQGYIYLHDSHVEGQGDYQDTLDALEGMKKAISHISIPFKRYDKMGELLAKFSELNFKFMKKEKETQVDDIPF